MTTAGETGSEDANTLPHPVRRPAPAQEVAVAQLEELTRGSAIKRAPPDGLVTAVGVKWTGTVAVEVTYKDFAGRLGSERLCRDRATQVAYGSPVQVRPPRRARRE